MVPVQQWHFGDEGEHLVRWSGDVVRERLMLGGQLGIDTQYVERSEGIT